MSFYYALLQMGCEVYNGEKAVVEAEIELPDFYQPQNRSLLRHPLLGEATRVLITGYDSYMGRPIFLLGCLGVDASVTVDEWLSQHKQWRRAEHPILSIRMLPPDAVPPDDCEADE